MIDLSRRNLVRGAVGASLLLAPGAALAQDPGAFPAAGLDLMLPKGFPKVVGFFGQNTRLTTREYRDWYEGVHAPDFAFAYPHLTRYARNWIVDVEQGPAPRFKLLTEIAYRSEEAKDKVRGLFRTPAAAGLAAHQAPEPPGARPPVPDRVPTAQSLIPVEPIQISGPASSATLSGPKLRRIVLLRRPKSASQAAFDGAARRLARAIARSAPAAAVSLDLRRGANPRPPADAILYLDSPSDRISAPYSQWLQVTHVLKVETHATRVG